MLSPNDQEKLNDIITLLRHSKDTSCIILVNCVNQILQKELEGEVRRRLGEEGFTFKKIKMSRNGKHNLPLLLKGLKPKPNKMFFIHDLKKTLPKDPLETRELPPVLQYLNYRREDFVDARISAVFWLDKPTLEVLAKRTPDFWAFRNLVVEFVNDEERLRFAEEMTVLPELYRYSSKRQAQKKINMRKKALADYLKTRSQDVSIIASIYEELGWLYGALSFYTEALLHYRKAYKAYQKLNDKHGQASVLSSMGYLHLNKGDFKKAQVYFKEALEMSRKIGGLGEEAYSLTGLGSVCLRKGEWAQAIQFHSMALDIARKIGDEDGVGTTFHNLGLLHYFRGDLEKAIELYNKSLRIKENRGDKRGLAGTLNNLGLTFRRRGDLDKAIEFYNKSFQISEKIGDQHLMAETFNNLGLLYQDKRDWDKAADFYKKSLKIKEKIGDEYGRAATMGNIGVLCKILGKTAEAKRTFEQILELFEKIGDKPNTLRTKKHLRELQKELVPGT